MSARSGTHLHLDSCVEPSLGREGLYAARRSAATQMTETFTAISPTDVGIASDNAGTSPGISSGGRLMGQFLMATVLALFWAMFIALIAPLAGFTPSPAALLAIALGIAAFLLAVCCALTPPDH